MARERVSKPLRVVMQPILGVRRHAAVADLRGGQSPRRQELERERRARGWRRRWRQCRESGLAVCIAQSEPHGSACHAPPLGIPMQRRRPLWPRWWRWWWLR